MIPKHIDIAGHEIKIEIISPKELNNNNDNWGLSCCDKGIIYLNSNITESEQEEVLAHEIKHFFDYNSGRNHYLISFEKLDYELQNEMTDNVFWRFLSDNTDFFKEKTCKERNEHQHDLVTGVNQNIQKLFQKLDELSEFVFKNLNK